jgi:hypothetical protein
MNHHDPTLPEIDPVEEELVAYLDEELEPEHRTRVELRLAEDARYREKLRHMQKSWDMLDVLSRSEPDESFARTTVAMVALKAKEATDVQKENTQRFSLLFYAGVAVTTVACLLIAYSVGSWLYSASDRQLVQDLPLIERLDEYKSAESVAYLKSLEGLFGPQYRQAAADAESVAFVRQMAERGMFVPEGGEDAEPASAGREHETLDQRRSRLEQMSPEQKQAIAEKRERFTALPPEEQSRLRKLAADIDADPDGAKLRLVLTNYHDWLKSLGAKDQSQVLSASLDERIPKIKQAQVHQASERLKAIALDVSPADVTAISDWMGVYVDGHLAELNALTPAQTSAQFRAAFDALPKAERISRWILGVYWRLGRKESLPMPTVQELDVLVGALSPKVQIVLEDAESHEQQWQFAQELILQVHLSRRFARVSDEELQKFAREKLTPGERESLEGKTAEEMKNALRALYYQRKAVPLWQPGLGQPNRESPRGPSALKPAPPGPGRENSPPRPGRKGNEKAKDGAKG